SLARSLSAHFSELSQSPLNIAIAAACLALGPAGVTSVLTANTDDAGALVANTAIEGLPREWWYAWPPVPADGLALVSRSPPRAVRSRSVSVVPVTPRVETPPPVLNDNAPARASDVVNLAAASAMAMQRVRAETAATASHTAAQTAAQTASNTVDQRLAVAGPAIEAFITERIQALLPTLQSTMQATINDLGTTLLAQQADLAARIS